MKTLAPNCTLLATNSYNNDLIQYQVNGLFLFHNIYVKEKMKKTKKTYPQQFANTSHKKNQILNFVKCNVSLPTSGYFLQYASISYNMLSLCHPRGPNC